MSTQTLLISAQSWVITQRTGVIKTLRFKISALRLCFTVKLLNNGQLQGNNHKTLLIIETQVRKRGKMPALISADAQLDTIQRR